MYRFLFLFCLISRLLTAVATVADDDPIRQ